MMAAATLYGRILVGGHVRGFKTSVSGFAWLKTSK